MAAQNVTPLFYSTTEAAKVLGVSQHAVLRMCRDGTLRSERIGRLYKVAAVSVHTFAGQDVPGHEQPSEHPELRRLIREARRINAELGRVLAEIEL